ncbi:uncharacterized protein JCM6883_004706 [Sporobolomyces salmoneus]|uniref:uncharacterized protein n=1 Tax=Sporobolomyces salmoneus TaxID=183962 RepID=UPI003173AFA0
MSTSTLTVTDLERKQYWFAVLCKPVIVLKGNKHRRPLEVLSSKIDAFGAKYQVIVVVHSAAFPPQLKFVMANEEEAQRALKDDKEFFTGDLVPEGVLEAHEFAPAHWCSLEHLHYGPQDRRQWMLPQLDPQNPEFAPLPVIRSDPEILKLWKSLTCFFPLDFNPFGVTPSSEPSVEGTRLGHPPSVGPSSARSIPELPVPPPPSLIARPHSRNNDYDRSRSRSPRKRSPTKWKPIYPAQFGSPSRSTRELDVHTDEWDPSDATRPKPSRHVFRSSSAANRIELEEEESGEKDMDLD